MDDRREVETYGSGTSTSLLDRPVNLASFRPESLAWIAVLATGLAIRLVGRTNWPLSTGEAALASDAFAWIHGNGLSDNATAHPATVQITGLIFFLFGDSDSTARLLPLLASVSIVAILFLARGIVGNGAAVSIAALWAVSPVMTINALRLDGGALLLLCVLLSTLSIVTLVFQRSTTWAMILGLSLGAALTAHPLGWVVLMSTGLSGAVLLRDGLRRSEVLYAFFAFAGWIIISGSWFMTRPRSLIEFPVASLSSLGNDYLMIAEDDWKIQLLAARSDEILALFLTAVVMIVMAWRFIDAVRSDHTLLLAIACWSLPLIAFGLMTDITSPAGSALWTLPMLVAGGLGLSIVVSRLWAASIDARLIVGGALVATGFLIAVLRLTDSLSAGPGADLTAWLINIIALTVLIVVPLAIIGYRIFSKTGQATWPTLGIVMVVLLAVISLRSSLLITSVSIDRPGEVLIAGSTAPAVGTFERRIHRYSLDATTFAQDARDPAGGRGLVIAIDQDVAQPFVWYFRRFPQLAVIGGVDEIDMERAPDLIIVSGADASHYAALPWAYEHREVPVRVKLPASMYEKSFWSVLTEPLNPARQPQFVSHLVFRDSDEPMRIETVSVLVLDHHALLIWGSTSN